MNLDALLHHYLGAGEPDPAALDEAVRRIGLDFGVERDSGRRFALWALMAMLGHAPDPEAAFKQSDERRAAHDFARMMRRAEAADDEAG